MRRKPPSKVFIKKQTRIVSLLFLVAVFYIWTTIPRPAKLPPTKSNFAMMDGNRVHYLNYGEGEKAAVFIHGWACDLSFWRFQVPALSKTRLILIDLPGHGKSDKPEVSYTQDLFAAGVNAVIEHSGVEDVVMIGHSMGFSVARQYMRNYPGKVKALVIVDGALFRIPNEPQKIENWKIRYERFINKFKGPDFQKATHYFMDSLFVEQTPKELRTEIKSKISLTPMHVAISALEGMADLSIWKEDIFKIPTMAIYAKRPSLPSDNGNYLKMLFPNLEYYEWDWVGHFLMMEKSKKFNRFLLSFLNRINEAIR